MIPRDTNTKYFILEEGDIILAGDEYYNPFKDKWMPVTESGYEFSHHEYKPIRRENEFNLELL